MSDEMPKFFEYMKLIGNLKKVQRTGWLHHGVKNPESVAEHMYRMAMVAFALPPNSTLNREKCIKIALVHDIGETIVGDITPNCGISKEEKSQMEENATKHIVSFLPDHGAQEVKKLWKEYEEQSSPEAKFVKDLDKFEMIFQAMEYEHAENRQGDLEEFFEFTKKKHKFSNETVQKWVDDLVEERANMGTLENWDAGLKEAKSSIITSVPKSSLAPPQSASSASSSKSFPVVKEVPVSSSSVSPSSAKRAKVDAAGDSTL